MELKKLLIIILGVVLFSINTSISVAKQNDCEAIELNPSLKANCSKFFAKDCSQSQKAFTQNYTNPIQEIQNFFNTQSYYLNNSNTEELKKLYSDDYLSNDGFNKETLFKLYEDTLKNHPDIKYDVQISKICTEGCYATARAINKSTATTAQKSEITGDNGLLTIDMETLFHLKKTGCNWQIVTEQTLSEKTTLLYGDCKNSGVELFAPECVPANTEYTATLKLPEKYSKYAMGSLKKELITYPTQSSPDIFKPFDSIGLIERIFNSNPNANNETVAASVAFALPKLDKSNTIDIKVSGLGVLLQRVNVLPNEQK